MCFKEMPNTVMFHLMRFTYDVFTQQRAKNNNWFSFPRAIDMTKYKYEHLSAPSVSQPKDMYELVGVILHTGSAEAGHYISFVRDRPSKTGEDTVWFEFDDDDVKIFDPMTIEDRCFGGPAMCKNTMTNTQQMKQNCAYMLLYQRSSAMQPVEQLVTRQSSPAVREMVDKENRQLMRDFYNLGPSQFIFVRELLGRVIEFRQTHIGMDGSVCDQMFKLCWSYLSRFLRRLGHPEKPTMSEFETILVDLRTLLDKDPALWHQCLSSLVLDSDEFATMLYFPNSERFPRALMDFIADGIKLLWVTDYLPFFGFDRHTDPKLPRGRSSSPFYCLIDIFRAAFQWDRVDVDRWVPLFDLLSSIAALGRSMAWAMIDGDILGTGLYLLSAHSEGFGPEGYGYNHWLQKRLQKKPPAFQSLVKVIYLLLLHINPDPRRTVDSAARRLEREARTGWGTHNRLPLTRVELEMITLIDEEGDLVWFDRMLSAFRAEAILEKGFIPSEVLKELRLNVLTNPLNVLREVFQRTMEHVRVEQSPGYIRIAADLCLGLPSEYSKRILRVVMDSFKDSDPPPHPGAYWHFVRTIFRSEESGVEYLEDMLCKCAKNWAPELLSTSNSRNNAELGAILANKIADDAMPQRAMQELFAACSRRFHELLQGNLTRVGFEEVLRIMKIIVDTLEDDDEQSRHNEFMAVEAMCNELPHGVVVSDDEDLEGENHSAYIGSFSHWVDEEEEEALTSASLFRREDFEDPDPDFEDDIDLTAFSDDN
jgi:ubiquitin carboxyl-terminal hydrolase 34